MRGAVAGVALFGLQAFLLRGLFAGPGRPRFGGGRAMRMFRLDAFFAAEELGFLPVFLGLYLREVAETHAGTQRHLSLIRFFHLPGAIPVAPPLIFLDTPNKKPIIYLHFMAAMVFDPRRVHR